MITINPYDTTVMTLNRKKSPPKLPIMVRTITSPEKTFVISNEEEMVITTLDTPEMNELEIFEHPLTVMTGGINPRVIVDGRPFLRFNKDQGEFYIHNSSLGIQSILRGLLTYDWMTSMDRTLIEPQIAYAGIVYANYIADTVTRVVGLSPVYKNKIVHVAIDYWYSMHRDVVNRDEDEYFYLASVLNGDPLEIKNNIHSLPIASNLEDVIDNIKIAVEDPRIHGLNIQTMTGALAMGWMGSNSRELVMVGIEHVPTWCAMVYIGATEKFFKKTAVASAATVYGRAKKSSFVRYMSDIIKTRTTL